MATVLCDAGRGEMVKYCAGTQAVPANFYGAWGTGGGTAGKTDTTLFTEAAESRVTTTRTAQSSNTIWRNVWTMTVSGSGKTITNAGYFDANSTGNLFVKGDFTGVALNVGDSIQFTSDLTFSN